MMEITRHSDLEKQLDELSESAQPGDFFLQVREFTRDLVERGHNRDDLLEIFEHYRSVLQDKGLEEQEDALLDVMDQLAGWAPSHARI
jgi:hemerythrin superfamily protein